MLISKLGDAVGAKEKKKNVCANELQI